MQERLWRLLGACELLTRDEAAALSGRDLAGLVRIQRVKAPLLADLAVEAKRISASCDSQARARLAALLEGNRGNARNLADMMADAREERRKVSTAVNQLQALRSAYATSGDTRQDAFSAHG